MKRAIFIIDTNVLVSGLITKNPTGPTRQILDAMFGGKLLFLLSHDLLVEYRQVLMRPKIFKAHGFDENEIDILLTDLVSNALWRDTDLINKTTPETSAPDPKDKHLWSLLSLESNAILVTGDQLLIKHPRPGSKIILPAECSAQLKA